MLSNVPAASIVASMSVKLPSGMIIEVRGLTVRDGRWLTNDDPQISVPLLENCCVGVVDPGPYDFTDKVDWNKALEGDRFYALIAIREASYPGDPYSLQLGCGSRTCKGKRFGWDINLAELLDKKTQWLSDPDAALFKAGNRFEAILPCVKPERKFAFKLKTGGDTTRTRKIIELKKNGSKQQKESLNSMAEVVASYIVSIEGVESKRAAILDFLEGCPLGTVDRLLPLIQSHDCGVDTTVQARCPNCGSEVRVELPFDAGFIMPHSTRAKSQLEESSSTEEDDIEVD